MTRHDRTGGRRNGIGLDTINVSDATEFGIMVANVPD